MRHRQMTTNQSVYDTFRIDPIQHIFFIQSRYNSACWKKKNKDPIQGAHGKNNSFYFIIN